MHLSLYIQFGMVPWWARGRGFSGESSLFVLLGSVSHHWLAPSVIIALGSSIGSTAENLIFGLDPKQEYDTPSTVNVCVCFSKRTT